MILETITLYFIIINVEGMSCKSNPCMYGVCKDVENGSYTCYCIDGYTGINCEINFNDCWSNPCLNGGTCIDGIAHYNCTCAEGFTGENCEIDASVCNDLLCENDGKCEEGFGLDFACKCAEGWTGKHCEDDINECSRSPCQNGGLCINFRPLYTCACLFGFTGKNCDEVILPCETNTCENDALCLLENDENICYCVPDYHGVSCELQYDNCEQNAIVCENGGTCINDFLNFTCNCLPQYTGRFCSFQLDIYNASTTDASQSTQFTSPSTTVTEPFLITATSFMILTTIESTRNTSDKVVTEAYSLTTDQSRNLSTERDIFLEMNTTVNEILNATSSSYNLTSAYDVTNYTTDVVTFMTTEESTTSSTVLTETSSSTVSSSSTILTSTTSLPSSTTMITDLKTTSTNYSLQDTTEMSSIPSTTFEFVTEAAPNTSITIDLDDDLLKESTSVKYTMQTTYIVPYYFTEAFEESTVAMILTTPVQYNVTEVITTSSTEKTVLTSTITDDDDYCDRNICSRRKFCKKFGLCDCIDDIKNIGFNGTSYLRHDVSISQTNVLLINVTLVTKSKNGILLHTLFDNDRYALLHIRFGQLQLQLSCGSQKILFGTIDVPVNNGYIVYIALSFQYIFEEPIYKCIAKLTVNDTVIMSGEQAILSYDTLPKAVKIYIGGIPVAVPYYISQAGLGFVGCLNSLYVNNRKRNLIFDATEINQISNCETFNCFLNPCENFGYCEDIGGTVKCNCLPGYTGTYCEKSVCDNSPCHFGATCITFPGSTFICVCPLGKHGLLCEKDLELTIPSFSTILPGLSSYMAFGFKSSIQNYVELNLRIKPLFTEQISLIAYIGQSNIKKNIVDYFALTFVQGYLMLTWDLGSGVRRIFTEIPLSTINRQFYNLNIGRRGKMSWMNIEGIGNITGSSFGAMSSLDVSSILYIGGHKSKNFEKLPHDLPLHTGFVGCISDIEMRTEDNFYKIQESGHIVGRNIGQCDSNECSANSCNNGAVCLTHGPSYRCICMKGWEGPDCTQKSYIPPKTCSLA